MAQQVLFRLKDALRPIQVLNRGKKKGKTKVEWGPEQEKAWVMVNMILEDASQEILMSPDWKKEFVVYTDASDKAYGAMLCQFDDELNEYRPIEMMSKIWTDSELRWAPSTKEFACVVSAVNKWKRYLGTNKFTIMTDAKNIMWLFRRLHETPAKQNTLQWRMLMKLAPYHFEVKHIKGVDNIVADYLSRYNDIEYLAAMMVKEGIEYVQKGLKGETGDREDDEKAEELLDDNTPPCAKSLFGVKNKFDRKWIAESAYAAKPQMFVQLDRLQHLSNFDFEETSWCLNKKLDVFKDVDSPASLCGMRMREKSVRGYNASKNAFNEFSSTALQEMWEVSTEFCDETDLQTIVNSHKYESFKDLDHQRFVDQCDHPTMHVLFPQQMIGKKRKRRQANLTGAWDSAASSYTRSSEVYIPPWQRRKKKKPKKKRRKKNTSSLNSSNLIQSTVSEKQDSMPVPLNKSNVSVLDRSVHTSDVIPNSGDSNQPNAIGQHCDLHFQSVTGFFAECGIL